mgnify:CR=1 FL=1
MLGSHNTMSYLPATKWWMKLITPWHRCQDRDIINQYNKGVRYFDIRLRVIDGNWHFVHNRIDYGRANLDSLKEIARLAGFDKDYIYFRFILDEREKPKDENNLRGRFLKYIYHIIDTIQTPNNNVILDSVITAWNWEDIEASADERLPISEYHASATHKWYNLILGTKIFSKLINTKTLIEVSKYTESRVILVDFI